MENKMNCVVPLVVDLMFATQVLIRLSLKAARSIYFVSNEVLKSVMLITLNPLGLIAIGLSWFSASYQL